jgi:Kef-type K+ transport system membrane component KefB
VVLFTAGLLLASGGEFAFVAFGEAVSKGVLPVALTSELYMVVALSMAMVPYLAALGGKLGVMFERSGGSTGRALSVQQTTCTAWAGC